MIPPGTGDAIAEVYAACDAALGRLIEAADPELVVIASDHGFGGAGTGVLYLNRFLEQHGWLAYRGDGAPIGGHRSGRGVVDALKGAALRLPGRAQERIVRALPARLLGAIETRSRWGDLDFPRTAAWSDEMNYAATIHLNVKGREPHGVIDDRDRAIERLTADLLAWQIDGRSVVARVWRREELYAGDAVERAPDLVLDLHPDGDGYTWTVLPSVRAPRGTTHRRLAPDERLGGKGLGMNGSHRREGTLVMWGKGIASRRRIAADIVDPLPTLFAAIGEAIPDHVDGRVLQDAFARPVRATWTAGSATQGAPRPLDAADAASVRRRLESLGYL